MVEPVEPVPREPHSPTSPLKTPSLPESSSRFSKNPSRSFHQNCKRWQCTVVAEAEDEVVDEAVEVDVVVEADSVEEEGTEVRVRTLTEAEEVVDTAVLPGGRAVRFTDSSLISVL